MVNLLHNIGGDNQIKNRTTVLNMYSKLKGADDFTKDFIFKFRYLYFFDADEIGISKRIENLNSELKLELPIEDGKILDNLDSEWGCYIFHRDQDSGDLEDILIEMIGEKSQTLITESEKYLESNELPEKRQKEFVCIAGEEKYKTSKKYKKKKSLISVTGQLQFSGMSNAVFIANTDHFNLENLNNNPHCVKIANLFS